MSETEHVSNETLPTHKQRIRVKGSDRLVSRGVLQPHLGIGIGILSILAGTTFYDLPDGTIFGRWSGVPVHIVPFDVSVFERASGP